MKVISACVLPALLALAMSTTLFAAEPKFAEPILLTSCGQSADILMLKTVLNKDSLKYNYLPNATADDLTGKGSVIVVVGGSSKGLGAAKTSPEQETARVSAILTAASKAGLPIVAVHMGGLNRRGALSDPFNQLGAEAADEIIVLKGGDDDGFFSKIGEARKIPVQTVTNAYEVGSVLMEVYHPVK